MFRRENYDIYSNKQLDNRFSINIYEFKLLI